MTDRPPYKSPGTAALIAFIGGIFGLPGIGHIYIGKVRKGVIILIIGISVYGVVLVMSWIIIPIVGESIMETPVMSALSILIGFGYFGFWIWQILDAWRSTKDFNKSLEQPQGNTYLDHEQVISIEKNNVEFKDEEESFRISKYKNIFSNEIVDVWRVTNYRVSTNEISIDLKDLDDIIVKNVRRESQGNYMSGTPLRGSEIRVGYGKSQSKTFGDLVFIHNGTPAIIFSNIEDPYGRKSMADAARKNRLKMLKEQSKLSSSNTMPIKQYKNPQSYSTICPSCQRENRQNAQVCDECGTIIVDSTEYNPVKYPHSDLDIEFIESEYPQYSFKIKYPINWYKEESVEEFYNEDYQNIVVFYNKDKSTYFKINKSKYIAKPQNIHDRLFELNAITKNDIKHTFQNMRIVNIGGIEGMRSEVLYRETKEKTSEIILPYKTEDGYVVDYNLAYLGITNEEYNKYLQVANKIINSFQFINTENILSTFQQVDSNSIEFIETESHNYNFKIKHPINWYKKEEKSKNQDVEIIESFINPEDSISFYIAKYLFPPIKEDINSQLSEMMTASKNDNNHIYHNRQFVTIGELQGLKMEYSELNSPIRIMEVLLYYKNITTNNIDNYRLMYTGGNSTEFFKYLNLANKIIDSFHLISNKNISSTFQQVDTRSNNQLIQREIPYGYSYLIKIKVPQSWSTNILEKEEGKSLHIVTFTNSSATIKFDITKEYNVQKGIIPIDVFLSNLIMNWKTLPNVQIFGYEKQTISNIPSILVEYSELGIRKFMTVLAKKIKYDKYDFYYLTYYGYEGEYYNYLDIAKEMMRSVEIIN